jgi:hypothetical protein
LIIWSGNLTAEIPWYLRRSRGGWQWLTITLPLLHFAAPFLALLSRKVKRNPHSLARVALLVLAMHVVDVYWLVMPAMRETLQVDWLDVVALTTLGSIWTATAAWRLNSARRWVIEIENEGLKHGNVAALEQAT